MQNRRLLFGVIIKILVLSGIIVLALVLVSSLFTNGEASKLTKLDELTKTVKINVENMKSGEIRKAYWQNREVAILLRQFPDKLLKTESTDPQETTQGELQIQTRSIKQVYFVYVNRGDSKNCPLHYARGVFKDICSANRFDEAGRDIKGNLYAYQVAIPPHVFEGNTVIIGEWKPSWVR